MQLEFNAILSSDQNNTANYSLSESVMDTYVSYEKYKTSIEESEHKYLRMQYDLDRVQAWVEQAEKVLQGRDQKKILVRDSEDSTRHSAQLMELFIKNNYQGLNILTHFSQGLHFM